MSHEWLKLVYDDVRNTLMVVPFMYLEGMGDQYVAIKEVG